MAELHPDHYPGDPVSGHLQEALNLMLSPGAARDVDFERAHMLADLIAVRALSAQCNGRAPVANLSKEEDALGVSSKLRSWRGHKWIVERRETLRRSPAINEHLLAADYEDVVELTETDKILSYSDCKEAVEGNLGFIGLSLALRSHATSQAVTDMTSWRSTRAVSGIYRTSKERHRHIRAMRLPLDTDQVQRRFPRPSELRNDFLWRAVLAMNIDKPGEKTSVRLADAIVGLRAVNGDPNNNRLVMSVSLGTRRGFTTDYLTDNPAVQRAFLQ